MSWGIIIPDVTINRVTIDGLEDKRESLKEMITFCRDKLLILASSSPNTSEEEWLEKLHQAFEENIDALTEYSNELFMVGIAINDKDNLIQF